MNPEEQIKVLAEIDGWTDLSTDPCGQIIGTASDWGDRGGIRYTNPPNYLTSRDAIIGLIERCILGRKISEQKISLEIYAIVARDLGKHGGDQWPTDYVSLTAPQLSEATIRAFGKWKE